MSAPSQIGLDRFARPVVISALVATFAYFAFSIFVGWRDVVESIARIGAAGLLAALALSGLNYSLRFLRWQTYLRRLGQTIPACPSAIIYLSGFAFTTTPGKAGELLRGVFLHRRGTSYLKSTTAFFCERLSDLIAVFLLALPGLALVTDMRVFVVVSVATGGLVLLAVATKLRVISRLAGWSLLKRGAVGALLQQAGRLLAEAKSCHTPRILIGATLLSLTAWGAEAFAFALILHLLGVGLPLSLAVFIYAASMLAGALTFLPGGLGGAEATMVALLVICGVPQPESAAATIVIRLTTLWFAVVLGCLLAVAGRRVLLVPVTDPA